MDTEQAFELDAEQLIDAIGAQGYLLAHAQHRGGYALVATRTAAAAGYQLREGKPITLALAEADLPAGSFRRIEAAEISREKARLEAMRPAVERDLDARDPGNRQVGQLSAQDLRDAVRITSAYADRQLAPLTARSACITTHRRTVRATPRARRPRNRARRARAPASRREGDPDEPPPPLGRLWGALARLLRGAW